MTATDSILIFRIDDRRFALPLADVARVIRAVEVTALPGAPRLVLGAINVHGDLVPVLDLRSRLHLASRTVRADDAFVLARMAGRTVALVVDAAEDVLQPRGGAVVPTAAIVAPLEGIPGVAKLDDGLVLIQDLEQFLSAGDEDRLREALDGAARQ